MSSYDSVPEKVLGGMTEETQGGPCVPWRSKVTVGATEPCREAKPGISQQ